MIPPQPPNQNSDLKMQGLSRQQLKRIEKSLKKPQFMGLLNEYMVQISDPKNKAQYDQYLKQMERQGQLPKHMKLVKLKPQFCFRTQIVSNRNKKHQMKFFINMCSSEYVDKPSCQTAKDQKGSVGYNWKVPNSLGKIRYDQDKHKNPCQVIDCAFHPDTFIFSNQNSAFQAMIISIALQGSQKQLGQRKQTLSRDYVILKNLKCKGQNGQPALLPIRYIDGKAYNKGEGPAEQQRNLQGKETKLQKQISKQKQTFQEEKKKSQQQQKKQQQQEKVDLDDGTEKKQLVQDLQKGIQAPKFTSIYTYITDYSQFIDGPAVQRTRSLPSMFTVQFKVPRMENISQASTLQINEKKIILAVQGKYYIDISFEDMKVKNYPLRYNQAKAKFDKKKKTLRVQIPVDVASIPEKDLPQFKEASTENNEGADKQNQGDKIVQNQTWKNKVLQIQQPQNVQKFLAQQQVQQNKKPQKKLIQQLDEDDFIQENQPEKTQTQTVQEELNQQLAIPQQKKFSASSYYQPTPEFNHQSSTVITQLNFIFKQSSTNVVVMFYMRNYKQSDVKLAFRQNKGQLVLLWLNKSANGAHFCLEDQYFRKINSIQVVKRIGYVAFIVKKNTIGQVWGQKCISNLAKKEANKTLNFYNNLINQITQQNAEKLKKQQTQILQAQNRQKQLQKNQQQLKHLQNHNQPSKIAIKNSINQSSQIDDTITSQVKNKPKLEQIKQNKYIQQNSIFKKLPIQFIKFNVPFIQTLN